jgi:hypothetical protein
LCFVDEKALSLTRITGIMCPGYDDDDDDDVVVDDNDDDDDQQHHHHHNNNNNKYDKYFGGGWWSHAPSLPSSLMRCLGVAWKKIAPLAEERERRNGGRE